MDLCIFRLPPSPHGRQHEDLRSKRRATRDVNRFGMTCKIHNGETSASENKGNWMMSAEQQSVLP